MSTQEVNKEGKKEIINHPARKIPIIYEPGKNVMTAQDKQLLDAYIRLHDFEQEMDKIAKELFSEFAPVKKEIEELQKELSDVKITFNKCRKLADKLCEASYNPEEISLEKLAGGQKEIQAQLISYKDKIMKVYDSIQSLSKRVDAYYAKNEDESNALYDEFSEIQNTHYSNWQNNSINIVSFDDEYNNFHSYRSVQEDRRENLLDFCDSSINDYTNLNLEGNGVFDLWTEFVKRCDTIRVMASLREEATGFTPN